MAIWFDTDEDVVGTKAQGKHAFLILWRAGLVQMDNVQFCEMERTARQHSARV